MKQWLTFKFLTSFILFVMVTVYSIIFVDGSINKDLWLCVWCLCLVRFVDVLDEM